MGRSEKGHHMVWSLGKQPGFGAGCLPQLVLAERITTHGGACSQVPTLAPTPHPCPREGETCIRMARPPPKAMLVHPHNHLICIKLPQSIVLLTPATSPWGAGPCITRSLISLGPRTSPCWLAHTTASWTTDSISSSDSDTPTVDE